MLAPCPYAAADESGASAGGDAAAGKALSTPCAACHGADGNSVASMYPSLAGQGYRYLLKQMHLIKDGTRSAPLMAGQLDNMSDADLQNLAAYFASQTPNVGQANDQDLELGERIYRGGLMDKHVTACTACHSPHGGGNALAGFPLLRGQPVEYLVDQLRKYREGERQTDEDHGGMMRGVARNLTDGEMQAVANYIHGLH
ncbi:MAG: cytochrome c4 [Candidatus Dadabacteria bacterium]|nr:MAG: cytochrome c4 [Candidatus Dadabacteria bacterium]